jgi:RNA polymerase sigma-70 factor (ECF subfamily)
VAGEADGLPKVAAVAIDEADARARLFTALYEQHFDFVWRSVCMLGATPDIADDAAQDVFLVAHRRLGDFEARSAPRTWLFAIALRVVSGLRRGRRRRVRLLEQARSIEREPASTPFESAVSAEARKLLLAALDALPDERRVVFMLAELEEMSAPEIAAALSVNLNTVYSRLRAARNQVAEQLKKLPGGPT